MIPDQVLDVAYEKPEYWTVLNGIVSRTGRSVCSE